MIRTTACLFGLVSFLLVLTGCNSGQTNTETILQLNWFPESEHGGAYQAAADGLYEQADLEVTIQAGGQGTRVGPELELGRCHFAFANADDVVLARNSGLDVVAVMAALQNHPRCIMVRKDSGVETFDDLAGKTLQREDGRAFVQFMREKGVLKGVQEVPYHGSIAPLVADPNIAMQAYVFAEPLLAKQEGIEVNTLMVSDLGFNPYSSVLVTSGKLIREQPERVKKFVAATQQGWQNYFQDSTKGNEAILAANKHGMTAEALSFGSEQMRSLAMPEGMSPDQVGSMSLERWQTLLDQMSQLGLIDAKAVKASECFTTKFLD